MMDVVFNKIEKFKFADLIIVDRFSINIFSEPFARV